MVLVLQTKQPAIGKEREWDLSWVKSQLFSSGVGWGGVSLEVDSQTHSHLHTHQF